MESQVKVYFIEGKAFLEVVEDYLLWIGDERFIHSLTRAELWDLAQSIMLEVKYGTRQPIRVVSNTVH